MTELTANYDDTWKKAIGEYFDSFLFFFYPDIHDSINWNKTPISLDKELEKITSSSETEKRHADKLYQVWLLDNQEVWLLIHVEVQSQYDKDFPLRIFIYNYRAFDLWAPRLIKFLVGFIDKMMTLPPPLQLNFKEKLNKYEKELNMQFLSTIEEMALERGAKETYQQNIIDLLKARFNSLPEGLEEALKKIDDLPRLKQLLIETIKINSVAEFEKLVNNNVSG